MKKLIRVMKALSDPSRVRIMKMLQRKTMCVCEIQEALGIAQSTASKHLKTLEDAGLVTFKKDGLWVNYTIADGKDSVYAEAMIGCLEKWIEDDADVSELVARLPEINRETINRRKTNGF